MLDIKEDIREECAKLGEVTNVVLFDKEPDGVASVRFSTPEAANACIRVCVFSYSQSIAFHIEYLVCSATFLITASLSRAMLSLSSLYRHPHPVLAFHPA